MVVKTDIEIAQACEKKKITEIAKTAGIPEAVLGTVWQLQSQSGL